MISKYTSIKSVVYDLSQLIDERYWNEIRVLEWATKAYRSMGISSKYVTKLCKVVVEDHKGTLPKDFARQTIVFEESTKKPLNLASSPAAVSACTDRKNDKCSYQYSIDENLVLTTNLQNTTLFIEYLGYPTDAEGLHLIPDEEVVKEAITAYVLWKYWLSKWMMKEEGSEGRMQYFRELWSTQSKKALSLNAPDIPQMENIKNRWNHIVPRDNMFQKLFTTLNQPENVSF